ncbi:MAG: hypothetical protein U5R31_07630 [Acidimicrobiia bacterium]|nr:hypothetical protein [Acidimicrobiia bacterium]
MAELLFSPEADESLSALERDPKFATLVGKIHAALDLLEADPGDVRCRRHRYQNVGVWGMVVSAEGEQRQIYWEPVEEELVHVHAIT